MRKLTIILIASATLGACQYKAEDQPSRGLSAVNTPVVARSDFLFDVAAPNGSLSSGEGARLNAWFHSLDLGYGDTVYVDGGAYGPVRDEIASVAGRYGLLLGEGAPLTPGQIQPGSIRVIVSRTTASVPGCPNWSEPAQPNYQNKMLSNSGCAVNSNLAAMVANPEDLIHGREGSAIVDARTSEKALDSYRSAAPTGAKGLTDISTKGGN